MMIKIDEHKMFLISVKYIAFVLSAGLLAQERFRSSNIAIVSAATVAAASSFLMFQEAFVSFRTTGSMTMPLFVGVGVLFALVLILFKLPESLGGQGFPQNATPANRSGKTASDVAPESQTDANWISSKRVITRGRAALTLLEELNNTVQDNEHRSYGPILIASIGLGGAFGSYLGFNEGMPLGIVLSAIGGVVGSIIGLAFGALLGFVLVLLVALVVRFFPLVIVVAICTAAGAILYFASYIFAP
jgi:hypothetical protein